MKRTKVNKIDFERINKVIKENKIITLKRNNYKAIISNYNNMFIVLQSYDKDNNYDKYFYNIKDYYKNKHNFCWYLKLDTLQRLRAFDKKTSL